MCPYGRGCRSGWLLIHCRNGSPEHQICHIGPVCPNNAITGVKRPLPARVGQGIRPARHAPEPRQPMGLNVSNPPADTYRANFKPLHPTTQAGC